jgi:cysteine desulfurase/selenocysteine lyase
MFDVEKIRQDFPILQEKIHGKPLVFLDSAASAQKPQAVIDAVSKFYAHEYANIHRGVYYLSALATERYEGARKKIATWINARHDAEIIFVRGATEGINLIARTFAPFLGLGDEIILTEMEHHSNIVPWQMVAEERGALINVVPMNDRGELELDAYETLLKSPRAKIVAFTHVSNALGTINPAKEMIDMAHQRGIPVLVDGAQAMPHMRVDVQNLGCDFYVFSGHKLFGPTGIGVLYGKKEWLERLPPYQGGGDMIHSVSFEKTTFAPPPHKFEAGTPHIAGAVGLAAAMDYLQTIGMSSIEAYEKQLLSYAHEVIGNLEKVRLIGTARRKASVLSFIIEGVHPHDIGTILDHEGIAIRAGHHCAQPIMQHYKVPATARASFALYNTTEEVDKLAQGVEKVLEVFL